MEARQERGEPKEEALERKDLERKDVEQEGWLERVVQPRRAEKQEMQKKLHE
jgi:hypothetical protein